MPKIFLRKLQTMVQWNRTEPIHFSAIIISNVVWLHRERHTCWTLQLRKATHPQGIYYAPLSYIKWLTMNGTQFNLYMEQKITALNIFVIRTICWHISLIFWPLDLCYRFDCMLNSIFFTFSHFCLQNDLR